MIRFTEDICRDLQNSQQREWLETNGLGGFASSTITGQNTRRYHGLLTAATKPPVGRLVLLSKLEETFISGEHRYELGVNQYPGTVHPQGHLFLSEFRLDPFPVFTYRMDGVELEKCVFMVHGENTVVVEYRLVRAPLPVTLEIRPLLAFRDYHSMTHENGAMQRSFTETPGTVSITPYTDQPTLHFLHNAGPVAQAGDWYRNFEYAAEEERGLDSHEDLFNPFVMTFDLKPGDSAKIISTIEARDRRRANDVVRLRTAEIERRAALAKTADDPLIQSLTAAADQFIVKRGDRKTIIAGYHWFADWGRDTMIALPGLALATGYYDIAKNILLEFAVNVDQGMLPNRFPDAGDAPEYNTVDAALWFFEAVSKYLTYTADKAFVHQNLYPKLKEIIDWHVRGTRYGIRMDPSGLLRCGEPGVQLTWMDAKVGDWVVTPRHGMPVEIQALWYNALRVMEALATEIEPAEAANFKNLALRALASFEPLFWNDAAGCLFDCVSDWGNGEQRDTSIRPNQIFAVSLPHSMLSADHARRVVETVQRELLTPLGLRTLARSEPQYRAHYKGGVWERDSAYHQGTVWPWLMGPFLTAYLKVEKHSSQARKQAEEWLREFETHFSQAGLGQISEICDAEAPHTPRGCIAQAWSVAELLRAATEDVFRDSKKKSRSA